ncbi:uncharacterized protein LOC132743633 isoform X2 [Ruditapes philippinarum]|uniref:uncharacterized protein LOC132743633 isoform X2 n=1 Tax=Ruditapes philippinarum TaxID=129788 RepID=UPI00295BC595|nr:uncharacterized protein LOC132743633 isoform X2 [Ruditapes philippinarum]
MDFIYKLLCCLVWFPLGGGTFCDPNRTRVKICTYQDVTNTTGVHIDTVRAPYFQQTSCECLITPITHTILLHFHLVSLSESVQFEINDISVDKNHVYKKTNITGAMKFLLTTNENYKSGGACLAVYSDNGDKFNISCTASTKETGQTRTLNIPQSSEAVNISRTRTVSPKTIQNITTNVSTGRVTSENSITTDNVNGNNDAKGDDAIMDSTGTKLQTTVLLNQTTVAERSELTAFTTSSTIKSTLYVSSNTMNDIESQGQSFCKPSGYPTIKVCTDDEARNILAAYIDTISVPDFLQTSCECVITPSRKNVPFRFNVQYHSGQRRMQFQINDIHLNKYNKTGRTNVAYAAQLLLSTEENHKRGGVCLAVFSEDRTYFTISCTKATEGTAGQSSPASISHGSRTTKHSTVQASKGYVNGDDDIKRDDANIDSTGTKLQTTVLSNQTLLPKGSELTAFTTSSPITSTLYVSPNTMNGKESQSQPFCKSTSHHTVKVCTDDETPNTIAAYIDTISVPDFLQTSCECVITPSRKNVPFNFNLINPSGRYRIQFKINDIHLGKYDTTSRTNLTYATKLLLSTEENHNRGGVCLAVYSEDRTDFKITCTKTTGETTRQSSPSSISHGSQTTESTTLKPIHSTMQATKDNMKGDNPIIFPSVTAACGLILGIVIAVVCVIFYKRRKKGKRRNATTVSSTNAPVEGDYYMTENAMYNMGQICTRETINENEHNNVNHNDGESPGHYDCIQESTDRNQSSENSPNHAVSNEYSTCVKVSKRSDGGSNNKRSIIDKEEQSQFSKMNGKDDTVYDSTISTFTQQAVGDNDYHHLGSVGLTGLNLTYDRIGNTGVVRH